jgi:DNA-binding NarL/FixJ family response regulator
MSALAELQRSPESTDLLVTDYNMPTMHGLDLVEKTWALRPGLKVVLASGFMGDGLSERAAAMGIRAQLNKERAVEDLIEVVLTALGQPHDGRLQ